MGSEASVKPEGARKGRAPLIDDGSSARDVALISVLLATITLLHLFTMTDQHAMTWHLLYRRLYYLPIIYAGFTFGRRGGLVTGLAASLLFAPHAQLSMGGLVGPNVDNLYEIVMYIAVGLLFGWLRDAEERKAGDLRQVSVQLEEAYSTLEERAIQLINIQDYTQSILRSITAGVLTVGPDGEVTTVNIAAERLLGIPEDEIAQRPIGSLFADNAGLDLDVARVLEGRIPKIVRETTLVTRGEKSIHAQVSMSRMRDIEGQVLGAVITVEDMSEVRALTDQLIRADRLAAMGELTAGVAHEVRNPLGVIRASVQLLEEAQCDPARITDATRVIKQEIDRLDRVIKALLDFGRPSKPTLMAANMQDVLDDVLMFTRRFASQSDVEILADYSPRLPLVRADADQMKQVFVNLISNAVQAMEGTGGRILVSATTDGSAVTISVADTGPGIPPEDVEKVFDPFFSTRDEGTGLGLTIVHRIIDEHGGHIDVSSTKGRGTKFNVTLPAA